MLPCYHSSGTLRQSAVSTQRSGAYRIIPPQGNLSMAAHTENLRRMPEVL